MTIVKPIIMLAVQSVLAGSLLLADTLSLKTGETLVGTFSNGNQNEIVFTANGTTRRYSVRDVRAIEFGPLPRAARANAPGGRWRIMDNSWVHFAYPANWQMTDEGDRVIVSPPSSGRFRRDADPDATVIVGMHREWGSQVQERRGSNNGSLEDETQNILADLGGTMRNIRQMSTEEFQLDGQRALKTQFTSISTRGIPEMNWLITSMHPQGVMYMVFGAPDQDFPEVEGMFQQMQNTFKAVR